MRTTARSRSRFSDRMLSSLGVLGTLVAIASVGVGVRADAAAAAAVAAAAVASTATATPAAAAARTASAPPATAPTAVAATATPATVTGTGNATSPAGPDRATVLAIAGRANATPWMVADGRFIAVAWGATTADGKTDVFVAASRNGGFTFGTPVQVNTTAGEARLGGELPPRVAITRTASYGGPDVAVLWTARGATTAIKIARSHDGARTFAAPVTLQSADAPGDRGWPALTLDDQSVAHAIWLDHRGLASAGSGMSGAGGTHHHVAGAATASSTAGSASTAASTSGAGSAAAPASGSASGAAPAPAAPPAAPRDGVAMAQRSGLYYAALDAAEQGRPGPERELTKGVCYCCKTSLVAGRAGALFAAWRQVYPGSFRDIAFSLSRDGGRTFSEPAPISRDGWAIDACPDDGPAMTVGAGETVHIVWPTVIGGGEPQGALFYTSTRDGHSFAARTRIPTLGSAKPSHPQIALDPAGRLFVAWDESVDGKRVAALREIMPGGVTFGPIITLDGGAPGMYPMLATTSDGLVAVWTSPAAGAASGTASARGAAGGSPAGSSIKVAKVNLAAAASTAKSGL
jgi:hypothetical protein